MNWWYVICTCDDVRLCLMICAHAMMVYSYMVRMHFILNVTEDVPGCHVQLGSIWGTGFPSKNLETLFKTVVVLIRHRLYICIRTLGS